jgi:hypothetical protein
MGLSSICRDVQIESQIFSEQSTIVAVAAQSRANLGDIYNSSQVYLNAGLEDRVALAKWQNDELASEQTAGKATDPFYQKLFDFLVYTRGNMIGVPTTNASSRVPQKEYAIQPSSQQSPPYTFLKQFMLKYNGEINFKALIPFKLKITLDGIGGIVVGQIFKVKNNGILPKNYLDKHLGFIVTKINHDLQNNDWTTTLETQICILDQDTFYDESGLPKLTKNIKREGFPQAANQALVESLLYPIIYAYAEYLTYRSVIGYLWAASFAKSTKIFPKSVIYAIDNYFTNSNQDNYKEYWGANIEAFISGGKNLSQFIGDYISKFKTNESARLNTIIYDGYTLNDALTDLQTKPQYTDITTKIQTEVFSKENLLKKLWYNNETSLDPSTFFSYGSNYPNTNVRPVNLNRTNVNTEINRVLVNSNSPSPPNLEDA